MPDSLNDLANAPKRRRRPPPQPQANTPPPAMQARLEVTLYCDTCRGVLISGDNGETVYCPNNQCTRQRQVFRSPRLMLEYALDADG